MDGQGHGSVSVSTSATASFHFCAPLGIAVFRRSKTCHPQLLGQTQGGNTPRRLRRFHLGLASVAGWGLDMAPSSAPQASHVSHHQHHLCSRAPKVLRSSTRSTASSKSVAKARHEQKDLLPCCVPLFLQHAGLPHLSFLLRLPSHS